MSLVPKTAYVLGNGPTLPVSQLYKLRGALTVGVNRILRSGFTPTVVFFADAELWLDEGDALRRTEALVVGADDVAKEVDCDSVVWAKFNNAPWAPHPPPPTRQIINISHNSASSMALWLLAFGVEHVQMLGCSGEVVDGRTHFYGKHINANNEQRRTMGFEALLQMAMTQMPLNVIYGDIIECSDRLDKPVHDVKNQDMLRAHLRDALTGAL